MAKKIDWTTYEIYEVDTGRVVEYRRSSHWAYQLCCSLNKEYYQLAEKFGKPEKVRNFQLWPYSYRPKEDVERLERHYSVHYRVTITQHMNHRGRSLHEAIDRVRMFEKSQGNEYVETLYDKIEEANTLDEYDTGWIEEVSEFNNY
jgi:peptidoglycan/xylan/chitin deacetylase (PgdA/CDA1 family)